MLNNILSNSISLADNIAIVVAIIALAAFILPLWQHVQNRFELYCKRRILEKKFGAELYCAEVIKNATLYYVQPDCSSIDPAQEADIRLVLTARQKLFEKVDEYLSEESHHRHLLLLADSGMGKTSFVLNYYANNQKKLLKYKRQRLAVVPLSISNADDYIIKIEDKKDTIIFLDAFDEDTKAITDHRKRLIELMQLCKDFKRVLITCRTQFFSTDDEIPKEAGIFKIGATPLGDKSVYEFWKLYLSPFNEQQIKEYLQKRYYFWQWNEKKQISEMINKISDLAARPMLLAYIPDVMEKSKGKETITYSYQLYEKIVDSWLERESRWIKDKKNLLKFSENLAFDLCVNYQKRERVPKSELLLLAKKWNISLEEWQLSGRSLLNRDAVGNYKFAHHSIMEFLFVEHFLKLADKDRPQIKWTDFMEKFLLEKIKVYEKRGIKISFSFYKPVLGNIPIPKSKFFYGDKKQEKNINYDYFIDKFLVTNNQYKKFIEDGGYKNKEFWSEQGWFWRENNKVVEPKYWNNGRWNQLDYPVVGVSWYEVETYCNWLSKSRGMNYRLPTEEEWEKASRGTDGGIYPWGTEFDKEKCNTYESGIGHTSEVSRYPSGISPYGCYDMVGNVWEWTDSWYNEEKNRKVLRGGSWYDSQFDARCTARDRFDPESRDFNVGFRCART